VSQARRSEGDAADDRAAVPDVRLVDLARRFADVVAVDGVSLDVARGEFFTLLGPSGSGKTTTLRLIAGFELPDGGRVELAGTDVTSRPAYARDVNTVFQDYALFPHMTVLEKGLLTIIVGHATFCIVVVFTTSSHGCGARRARSRRPRPTSAPRRCRRSATSGSPRCARPSWPARCSPSP